MVADGCKSYDHCAFTTVGTLIHPFGAWLCSPGSCSVEKEEKQLGTDLDPPPLERGGRRPAGQVRE